MLRAILCRHAVGGKAQIKNNLLGLDSNGRRPWAWLPPGKPSPNADDWEDPKAFNYALEKFEAWIFTRIVESVWWQVSHITTFHCSVNCEVSIYNNGLTEMFCIFLEPDSKHAD